MFVFQNIHNMQSIQNMKCHKTVLQEEHNPYILISTITQGQWQDNNIRYNIIQKLKSI
jgi:hypothetical protein